MPKYTLNVKASIVHYAAFEVEADNEQDAYEKAYLIVENADNGKFDWGEGEYVDPPIEYDIVGVTP